MICARSRQKDSGAGEPSCRWVACGGIWPENLAQSAPDPWRDRAQAGDGPMCHVANGAGLNTRAPPRHSWICLCAQPAPCAPAARMRTHLEHLRSSDMRPNGLLAEGDGRSSFIELGPPTAWFEGGVKPKYPEVAVRQGADLERIIRPHLPAAFGSFGARRHRRGSGTLRAQPFIKNQSRERPSSRYSSISP